MRLRKRVHAVMGMGVAVAMMSVMGLAVMVTPPPQAHAVSMSEYQKKVASQANLKAQLAGVSSDLADAILQLNDLTENQIPAAVSAAQEAQQAAEQATAQAE